MLRIYVSAHCIGCGTALRLADHVHVMHPDVPLMVVDVDNPAEDVPSKIIGTPIYTWNNDVLFMGNPSEAELLRRVGALHDDTH